MSIVSVVVPAYNTELFIRSCIESVLANDDVELILVDDGSTDNTLNIIKMRETADGFFGADHIPSYVNEAIGKTIRSMYLACRKLSSEEEKRLGEMTPEEREAFNGIMADLEESERIIRALNSEKADLKGDNEKLRKEREEIVSSLSYKIGRGITFVPRRIGALAKKWKS